jgi:murein DD-endopeptidase MepM/ murein hydrolase activator NlpD
VDLPEPITSLEVRPESLVEGQTFRLHLTTSKAASVSAVFMGRNLNYASDTAGTSHVLLQGIPVFATAGVYPLELSVNDGSAETRYTLNLQVLAGYYGSEYIQLIAGRDGLLDPTLEQSEQARVAGIMSQFTPERYFDGLMSLPAAATVISPFGTRRSYNGGAFDRYHSGTDFAGAPGTAVLAAAPGRVVLAEMLNVRGAATIIDHGWGVFTGYWHQSQQYVQVGDVVSTGQVIGAIGSTGRVTGAHLHWELWVGGVAVDPMQWVRTSFL